VLSNPLLSSPANEAHHHSLHSHANPSTSSSPNFQSFFNDALKTHEKRTVSCAILQLPATVMHWLAKGNTLLGYCKLCALLVIIYLPFMEIRRFSHGPHEERLCLTILLEAVEQWGKNCVALKVGTSCTCMILFTNAWTAEMHLVRVCELLYCQMFFETNPSLSFPR
jgi:glucose-6-phosphate-specific signal transduction histidine kinase